jgi:hypothetical protein
MAEQTGTLRDASRDSCARRSGPHDPKSGGNGSASDPADLTVDQVLAWADAYHAEHGAWPTVAAAVAEPPGDSWKAINYALALGLRGLPGDSSLAEFLAEHRGAPAPDMGPQSLARKIWAWEQEQFPIKKPKLRLRQRGRRNCPRLTIDVILAWADAHCTATGVFPAAQSGPVRDAPFDVTWLAIDSALKKGNRGLPGGSSLGRLLIEQRGLWPDLTVERILAWADAHHAATGRWPASGSGKVLHAPGEVWSTLNLFLKKGGRGLPGGQNLCGVLAAHRGVVNGQVAQRWSVAQVLAWADAHHAKYGRWPSHKTQLPVGDGVRTTWSTINAALREGRNGPPGGTTLTRLIIEHRGPEACNRPKPLTMEEVRKWMGAHRSATGKWPTGDSGLVRDAPCRETWKAIEMALRKGSRGLPAGWSLARLRPGYVAVRPPLTIAKIMAWADAHRAAFGEWPNYRSGEVKETNGECWSTITTLLRKGGRGLPGGQSLAGLLAAHRGLRKRRFLPRLSVEQILAWADAHLAAHGTWPAPRSGPVDGVPGETWAAIDRALSTGQRGLAGGTTLVRLLGEHRPRRARGRSPELTEDQILAWADAHHEATRRWPVKRSGSILGTHGETWSKIADALSKGTRGLPGGSSLARLLARHRGVQNHLTQPTLTRERILAWADAHHEATGRWPTTTSGPVTAAPSETWLGIQAALYFGLRGLPGASSLARLLASHPPAQRRPLTVETIQAWAKAHHRATGLWPGDRSGPVAGAPGEYWRSIDKALRLGKRGLPGGMSLAALIGRTLDPTVRAGRPNLTVDQILGWADAHRSATGRWPIRSSGTIPGAPHEKWCAIHAALRNGSRGLPGGSSLAQLLLRHRNVRPGKSSSKGKAKRRDD